MIDFLRCKKNAKKTFVTWLRVTKLMINKQSVAVSTCKKVEYTPSKLYEKQRKSLKKEQNTKRLFLAQIAPSIWHT